MLSETHIGRLTVSGCGEISRLAARAKRAFLTADLRPRGMSKSSILFVRHLKTELADGWQASARANLEESARRALHPACTFAPAGCDAVIFSDMAELLACLARDYCDGYSRERWWWSRLLKTGDLLLSVLRLWQQYPEHVPAAFELLARANYAVRFAAVFPDSMAVAMTTAVRRAFRVMPPGNGSSGPKPKTLPRIRTREEAASRHLLAAIVPEAKLHDLTQPQQVLVCAALLLRRAPELGRSADPSQLLAAAGDFQHKVETKHVAARNPSAIAPPRVRIHAQGGEFARPHPENRFIPLGNLRSATTNPRRNTRRSHRPDAGSRTFSPAGSLPAAIPASEMVPVVEREQSVAFTAIPERSGTTTPISVAEIVTRIETGYAGCFYLVNTGIALGLYGDFLSPAEPGIDLPIWDFMAIVGHDFCGPAVKEDPLWAFLAALSGREVTEEPGKSFTPPADWRMPREWLQAFPERDNWIASHTGNRFQLVHPRGFAVVDVPGDDSVDPIALSGLYPFDPSSMRQSGIPCAFASPFERWRRHLVAYLVARLGPLAWALCARHGRVELTSAHLDVIFPLQEIDIDIRCSGLDRDPGWVPAAGRFIAFHYE